MTCLGAIRTSPKTTEHMVAPPITSIRINNNLTNLSIKAWQPFNPVIKPCCTPGLHQPLISLLVAHSIQWLKIRD